MKRRGRAGGKTADVRRPRAAGRKRRAVAKPKSQPRAAAAGLQERLERNKRELNEALQQQAATSEVLRLISAAPGDLKRVFGVILKSATRLCQANFGTLYLAEGDFCRAVAMHNAPAAFTEFRSREPLAPITGTTVLARVAKTKRTIQVVDMAAEAAAYKNPQERRFVKLTRVRSLVTVPMLKGKELIGLITVYRQEVRPFGKGQVDLLTSFAAQAVIAIENTRLLNELRESLERQTATSEVLSVVSASPGDLEPVFQAMLKNATRICAAKFGMVFRFDGDSFHFAAEVGTAPELVEFIRRRGPFQPPPSTHLDLMMRTKRVSHTADAAAEPVLSAAARLGGARSNVAVPMLKDNQLIGAFTIYRQEVQPFTDKQIALVQNFAAQAVIAIENTRLLSELRQSLQQQTATSEVLRVISSSPGELEPVFDAMLANATQLCDASYGTLWLHEGDGQIRAAAFYGDLPEAFREQWGGGAVFRPSPTVPAARAMLSRKLVQLVDLMKDQSYVDGDALAVAAVQVAGIRSIISVPMVKDDVAVGAMTIYRREVRPFTDKQIALVANFAAQAVIAIENTRLLSELRQSLEQQTATADVLKVISSSPGDLEPVFQAMLEKATRICEAKIGILFRYENGAYTAESLRGVSPAYAEFLSRGPIRAGPATGHGRVASTKQTVHIADIQAEQVYADR